MFGVNSLVVAFFFYPPSSSQAKSHLLSWEDEKLHVVDHFPS